MRRGGEKKSLGNGGINFYVNTLLEKISGRKGQKKKKKRKQIEAIGEEERREEENTQIFVRVGFM